MQHLAKGGNHHQSSTERIQLIRMHLKKTQTWDFPGDPVVENPSCNSGDPCSIPGQETKIPHASEQLNLCTTTTEFSHCSKRSRMPQPRPEAAKQISK